MECAWNQYCARINSAAAVSIVHMYLWCVLRVNTVQGSALQQYSLVQFWQCYGARVKLLGWSRNWFFMSASAQTVKSRIYNPSNWCLLSFTVFTYYFMCRALSCVRALDKTWINLFKQYFRRRPMHRGPLPEDLHPGQALRSRGDLRRRTLHQNLCKFS